MASLRDYIVVIHDGWAVMSSQLHCGRQEQEMIDHVTSRLRSLRHIDDEDDPHRYRGMLIDVWDNKVIMHG